MLSFSVEIVARQSTKLLAVMSSKAGACLDLIASFRSSTVAVGFTLTENAPDTGSPLMRQKSVSVFVTMAVCVLCVCVSEVQRRSVDGSVDGVMVA